MASMTPKDSLIICRDAIKCWHARHNNTDLVANFVYCDLSLLAVLLSRSLIGMLLIDLDLLSEGSGEAIMKLLR